MAHTLQLALKDAMKHRSVESTILKARRLVHAIWKSSVANEQMVKRCGKTLIRDCSTRWNSTLDMMKRLLEVKGELNQMLVDLNMDTLLTSDWVKIENLLNFFLGKDFWCDGGRVTPTVISGLSINYSNVLMRLALFTELN